MKGNAPAHHPLDGNVWTDAIRVRDFIGLGNLVREEFDFDILDSEILMNVCCSFLKHVGDTYYSEQTWRMIVKHVILTYCQVIYHDPDDDTPEPRFKVTLHTGYTGVYESDEHIAILENRAEPIHGYTYDIIPKEAKERILDSIDCSVARSKIFRTNQKISPIDQVAARVAPKPDDLDQE